METAKLVVKDVVRFFPNESPRELATSRLLFNLVVPSATPGIYVVARSLPAADGAYLVLDVEDIKLSRYAVIPPPGHFELGMAMRFKAVVLGWRPTPGGTLEMEVAKLTDKALVLELQYKHRTIATGAWPLSRLFGTSDYISKGTFAQHLRDNKKRIELGQVVKAIVSSYEIQEVGSAYRFRLNFADVTPPWRDGSQERRRARASTTLQLGAT